MRVRWPISDYGEMGRLSRVGQPRQYQSWPIPRTTRKYSNDARLRARRIIAGPGREIAENRRSAPASRYIQASRGTRYRPLCAPPASGRRVSTTLHRRWRAGAQLSESADTMAARAIGPSSSPSLCAARRAYGRIGGPRA